MNVVIIGAGQLGSRHLQGLALLKQALDIYLVDPSENSLKLSQSRFLEVGQIKNKTLTLLKNVEGLPNNIEFAIIATTSKYRLDVMKQLLNNCSVKYLVLEKFLFPLEKEYKDAMDLLATSETSTYVNCTRRQFEGYKKLKEQVSLSSKINLVVEGSNWNLASNAIHYVDLFQFLSASKNVNYHHSKSKLTVEESKHKGYIEFTGEIIATSDAGHSLKLLSSKKDDIEFSIKLETDKDTYIIDEVNQKLKCNGLEENFLMYFQSQLTHKTFEQLQIEGNSDLITFKESCVLHLGLLKLFNHFLEGEEGIVT